MSATRATTLLIKQPVLSWVLQDESCWILARPSECRIRQQQYEIETPMTCFMYFGGMPWQVASVYDPEHTHDIRCTNRHGAPRWPCQVVYTGSYA